MASRPMPATLRRITFIDKKSGDLLEPIGIPVAWKIVATCTVREAALLALHVHPYMSINVTELLARAREK